MLIVLAQKDEVNFCMRIASDLTVRARSLYSMEDVGVVAFYKAFNDLIHLLVNQALNAIADRKRYDIRDFLKIIVDLSNNRGIGAALDGAFDILLIDSESNGESG